MAQIDLLSSDPITQCVSRLSQTYDQIYTITSTDEWWHFTPLHPGEKIFQGWKLHLPALPEYSVAMLEIVSNVLARHAVHWKVCPSINRLITLLSPPLPLGQVGKFITIYPQTTQQALELAEILHNETRQFQGPVIPSDRRYMENSQVYYRYGAFQQNYFYDPVTALRKFSIVDLEGKQVEDRRAAGQSYPQWITNPFPSADVRPRNTQRADQGFLGKDLRVKGVLHQSAKGGVYAVARGSETFILKEARFGTCPDQLGRDARERLTNEFAFLRQLSPLRIAPEPIELFDAENNRYLLMEHLVGHSLRVHIEKANHLGGYDAEHLRSLCNAVIDLVHQCHASGIVLRDLTPNNILVTPDGCKLIDFELAYFVNASYPPFPGYTPGYVPHSMIRHSMHDTYDYDRYALGATLFFILTGFDPYLGAEVDILPQKQALLQVFLSDTRLRDLAAYVEETLAWPMEDRSQQPSASAIPAVSHIVRPSSQDIEPGHLSFEWDELKEHAIAIAEHLYETADWQKEHQLWSEKKNTPLMHPACFQTGTAGIAYFFIEMAEATHEKKYYTYAKRLIDWTTSAHPFVSSTVPAGLYFGYAAIPWIQGLLAAKLNDHDYQQQALSLANRIADTPIVVPDITHGAAGIGLMHLALYRLTGNKEQLLHALRLSRQIVNDAEEDQDGNVFWRVNDVPMWGFAHGTAGIASFLLAMHTQIEDAQLREIVEKAANSLTKAAVGVRDARGLTWPQSAANKSVIWTHWCNGAAGVGRFFVEAAQSLRDPNFERMAIAAGYAVSTGRDVSSCGQCHGLAGDG
ncbi:MAG: hypothetical protein JO215_16005, partial [Ktedonobacteraceae bacterium]|nr:hypothetical protein [Ktedonobacteraceae bacterium]